MTAFNPAYDIGWERHGRCGPRGGGREQFRALFMTGGGPRWFGGPGGPGPGGPRGRHGRGGRARRGDVRLAALLLLAEEPRNGYAIMQELEQRTDGVWRPSPGSVYPALSQLEDEGLIRSTERDGNRVFEITDAGRQHLAERPDDAPAPWDAVGQGVPKEAFALFGQMRQLGAAAMQVAQSGTPAQAEKAGAALEEARRTIYRILADGE